MWSVKFLNCKSVNVACSFASWTHMQITHPSTPPERFRLVHNQDVLITCIRVWSGGIVSFGKLKPETCSSFHMDDFFHTALITFIFSVFFCSVLENSLDEKNKCLLKTARNKVQLPLSTRVTPMSLLRRMCDRNIFIDLLPNTFNINY